MEAKGMLMAPPRTDRVMGEIVKKHQSTSPDQSVLPVCARALHSLLYAWFDQTCRVVPEADWPAIRELASRTKILGLVPRWACPDERLQRDFAEIRAGIVQQNMRNLAWTIKVHELLRAGGIDALFFKGTIRSSDVYGSLDCRSSNDIDVLVRPSEYSAACALLQQNSYRAQVSPRSIWWHTCLGESPFRQEEQNSPYIDLHHQIQQPGGPYPTNLMQFFSEAGTRRFGRTEVSVPSPAHALIIAIINYGKALRAGEPTIARLHEISFSLRKGGAVPPADVLELARRQGLENLASEAMCKAFILFPRDKNDPYHHPEFDKTLLASLCMTPSPRFARTKMLWRWTDGTLANRVARFGIAVQRVAANSFWRWLECRTGRIQ